MLALWSLFLAIESPVFFRFVWDFTGSNLRSPKFNPFEMLLRKYLSSLGIDLPKINSVAVNSASVAGGSFETPIVAREIKSITDCFVMGYPGNFPGFGRLNFPRPLGPDFGIATVQHPPRFL